MVLIELEPLTTNEFHVPLACGIIFQDVKYAQHTNTHVPRKGVWYEAGSE